jgi:O-acetyl-ADP-ribose deacetylase (regulator of RNase III)
MQLQIVRGNITSFNPPKDGPSAIVNAANLTILGVGGVDGAIHRAAGPALRGMCEQLPVLMPPATRCMTGDARLTGAGDLTVDYVIHAVGPMFPKSRPPVFPGERVCTTNAEARSLLRRALHAVFTLAVVKDVRHLALPAISCGVFGCDVVTFAEILHETLTNLEQDKVRLPEVTMYLFEEIDFEVFQEAWALLTKP